LTLTIHRLRAAATNRSKPAVATSVFSKFMATPTAAFRKLTYPQVTPVKRALWPKIPPLGTIILLLGYLGFILALEYINNDVLGAQYYTALGVRAGWLAIAQIPLLILLAGKNNLIGFVTGVSYERLNVLHRWVARGVLLMATLHVGYQNYGWNLYGLRQLEWSTDDCTTTGLAVYVLLCWQNLSTLAPLRNLRYEFFVFQHLITFVGFIVAIMLHLQVTVLYAQVYIWIPVGLYLFDRLVRTLRAIVNNIHPGQATLEALPGGVTRIRVQTRVKGWSPGAHVLLAIPRYGIGQSHPATIASTPTSHNGDLLFILKAQNGFTKTLLQSANSLTPSFLPGPKEEMTTQRKTHTTFIDGPYGASQGDFACFDTVLLVAGSTGATFTLPILLDLAHRAKEQRQKLPVRRVEFVWIIKSASHISWISKELQAAFTAFQHTAIDMKVRIFVTRDERLTDLSLTRHQGHSPELMAIQGDDSPGNPIEITDAEASRTGDSTPPSATNSSSTQSAVNEKPSPLEYAIVELGRPAFRPMVSDLVARAEGETGVVVCGPLGLSAAVRMTVANLTGHKSTDVHGIYLHVEGFSW
jgi:ferric-chelate reductase